MLLKLLKHDFKMNGMKFLTFYLIAILLAAILRIGGDDLFNLNIIGTIVTLAYMLIIYILGFVTIVICIQSFSNSLFKKEGYLTLTLPVSTDQLVLSKIIIFIVWTLLSFIVITVTLCIAIPDASEFINELIEVLKYMHFAKTMAYMIPLLFLNMLEVILLIYLIITFVNTCYIKRFRGIIGVVLFFVITRIISFVKGLIIPSLSLSVVDSYSSIREIRIFANTVNEYFSNNLILMILIPLLLCVLFYFGIRYLLNKKIELD